ncbi:hypothetical protein D9615_001274 [Tricholomella constricta]|uniref:PB1 domain-containing protein n=1 Tax=Tricholomella constricta TaxID=117010 RepID=A0A8H5HKR3_9AGAR|nr:hypothetical protein D9615_001274 [Tricholomella constricta]
MATTHFKLTEPNGLTRRVTFAEQPTWHALSARIELLYGIPIEKVSVSYIDADNDQVTLSSQEELDDFYRTFYQAGQAIKFTVQDLSSMRLQRTLPQTPHTANFRNTFGIGAFDIEDDWQTLPIPQLGGLFAPPSSNDPTSHAFVEVVETDASTISNREGDNYHPPSVGPSSVHSSPDSPFLISLDKGKEKATDEDDVSSTGSVIAEDAPPKHPVHVYDLSSLEHIGAAAFHSPTLPTPPVAAQSTPKVNAQTFYSAELDTAGGAKDLPSQAEGVGDPPLPSLEPESATRPLPSLSSDIATLLNTFSNVVAAHPELSEGMRNIMRNASSGTYWEAHREAISRAAQDIAKETGRATENLRRETEEEAGRRVAEALGGVFRTLSQTLGVVHLDQPQESTATPADDGTANNDSSVAGNASPVNGPSVGGEHTQPSHSRHFDPWMHRATSFSRWGPRVPHPPTWGSPRGPYGPPVPPPPPPTMPGSWHGWVPPPAPPFPPPPPSNPPARNKPTPQELRAQVDAAKAHYKAEKERYRQEREERRQERERRARVAPVGPTAPVSPPTEPVASPPKVVTPAIAVHGKGGKATHEVVSVNRHYTNFGHDSSKRHGHDQGDLKSRAVHRITKRLADMGFTENAYPDLPSKIKIELPSDGFVTKEGEDNIVTTLLEELLTMSPKPPMASGSGSREIPAANATTLQQRVSLALWAPIFVQTTRFDTAADHRSLWESLTISIPLRSHQPTALHAPIKSIPKMSIPSHNSSRPSLPPHKREHLRKILRDIIDAALGDGIPRVLSPQEVFDIRHETAEQIDLIRDLETTQRTIAPRIDVELEDALFKARATYRILFTRTFRMNELPNEIITNIFRYVVWSVPDPKAGTLWRLWLTWTCRRWRTIALDDHTVWNAVWFRDHWPFDRSWAWFERARSAPLDIRISRESGINITAQQMGVLMDRLLTKLPNIRMLLIMVEEWDPALVALAKLRDAGQAGVAFNMERFELHRTGSPYVQIGSGYEPSDYREPMALFGGAPSPPLRTLSLNGIHVDWNASIISNLHTLDLRRMPIELSLESTRFREILSSSPNMKKLCLDGAGPQLDLNDRLSPIDLKHLKTLVIADFTIQYAHYVLSHISAPHVKDLTLINMTGDDYAPLFQLLTGRFPMVELLAVYTIELAETASSAATIVRWLETMPKLRYLRIANMPGMFLGLFLHDPRNVLDPGQRHPAPRQILSPKLSIIEAHPNSVPQLLNWVVPRARLGAPLDMVYIASTNPIKKKNPQEVQEYQDNCRRLSTMTQLRLLPFGAKSAEEEALMK